MRDKIKSKEYSNLVDTISEIIVSTQNSIAKTVNKAIIFTYWNEGKYIVEYMSQ